MNKKFSIILNIALVVFLTNICGATFLSSYVSAVGTADVSAPEFYLGSYVDDELLLINEKPSNCQSFGISNEYRTFKTEDLGGVNFNYIPSAEFSVRARVATTTSQDLMLKFGYYDVFDTEENSPHYLCSATVVVDNVMDDYPVAFQNCDYAPTDIKRFFYEFRKDEDCLDCTYSISKCADGFYTKIKLDKQIYE